MDPLLLSGLIGVGGELIGGLPTLLPNAFNKEQKAKLKELKRREELGLLGLTEQERAVLESGLAGRSKQASDSAAAERNRLLAGNGGAVAGSALQQATLIDEARARQEVEMQNAIEQEHSAEIQRETQELAAREAQVAQIKAEKAQVLKNIGASAFDSLVEAAGQNQAIQGAKGPSSGAINALVQKYGVGKDEARGLLEFSAENPFVFDYLDSISGE